MNRKTVKAGLIDLMTRKADRMSYREPYEDRSGLTILRTEGCSCCSSELLPEINHKIVLETADMDLTGWDVQEKIKEIIQKELTPEDLKEINIAYIQAKMKTLGLTVNDLGRNP